MDKLNLAIGQALSAVGDGYTPADFATDTAGGAGQVLAYVAVGVAGGIGVMFAITGIRRGIAAWRATSK